MPDIFISYSSKHRDLTERLALALEGQTVTLANGRTKPLTVWWDRELRPGDRFSPEITQALDEAKAVVVVWTPGAVTSDWVYAEAVRAGRRKVVTVRAADLDPALIPMPFNIFHTCLAEDTAAVLAGIARRLAGKPDPATGAQPPSAFRGFLLDPKQEPLPTDSGARAPASLLLAKHRVVPFADLHELRTEFVHWAAGPDDPARTAPALGRLLHGSAGVGKTRALIEIADELTSRHGWLAGFVPRDVRGPGRELSEGALERLILNGQDAAGLLLIVDYAESRQDDVMWLADRLVRRKEDAGNPCRLVLLSRGAGDWWRELLRKSQSLQYLCSLGGDLYDERAIPEAIAKPSRRALFEASVAAFRRHRGALADGAAAAPPQALLHAVETADDYDRPLAVQIAALLHVAGVDTAEGRGGMAGLLEKVLGLEYAFWDKALEMAGRKAWLAALKHAVAQVTLVEHVADRQRAQALVRRGPLLTDATNLNLHEFVDILERLFPGPDGAVAALEPDLIAEHHVLHVLQATADSDALVDGCLDWAGENPAPRRNILTVLNRATRPEHGAAANQAEAQLRRLLARRAADLAADLVAVAPATPGRLLFLFEAQVERLDESALAAIDAVLPLQSLALMDLSLRVAAQRLELARNLEPAAAAAAGIPPEQQEQILGHRAARAGTLGIRLSNLGRREDALKASQEAVDIRRRLAEARPDAFLPDLAMSLNNTGAMLSNLGRREDALKASQEAVDIRRRLAEARPDAFLPDLARSLNNLGGDLSNLGRREDALKASQEAVDIRRRLAEARPDAFLPDLAMSLGALGQTLAAADRHAEAAAAAREGLAAIAPFVARHPDAFGDLAGALAQIYLAACGSAGIAPDTAVLPILRTLGLGGDAADDAAP